MTIELTRGNGSAREPYLTYKLKDVIVTSFAMRGGAGNDTLLGNRGNDHAHDPLPTEEVTLGYTEVEWTYLRTTSNGAATRPSPVSAADVISKLRSGNALQRPSQ